MQILINGAGKIFPKCLLGNSLDYLNQSLVFQGGADIGLPASVSFRDLSEADTHIEAMQLIGLQGACHQGCCQGIEYGYRDALARTSGLSLENIPG